MSTKELFALVVLALVMLGAAFGYMAFRMPSEETPQAPVLRVDEKPATAPAGAAQKEKSADYSPIWQTISRPPPPKSVKSPPPKPPLKLYLKGTIFRKTERMAVIEDSTGRQRLVMEGGTIEGARITKIGPITVTLDVDGKKTVLRLERKPQKTPKAHLDPE